MKIIPLEKHHMNEWIELIKQLSPSASIGNLSERSAWFDLTKHQPKSIFVATDESDKVIGTVSILFEEKVNRGTKNGRLRSCAHIEEVVVDRSFRGIGVGKELMKFAIEYARSKGAYKCILDCSEENVAFYEKCGLKKHEVSMRIDL